MGRKDYIEVLTKVKENISLQLEQLRPYDMDHRERNPVVESLEEAERYINWEILDSINLIKGKE